MVHLRNIITCAGKAVRELLLLLPIACFLFPVGAAAQSESVTGLAVGGVNRLDTYLSPINYTGIDVRFFSSVLKGGDKAWGKMFAHDGGIDYTDNPAGNANTLGGHYDFAFSMLRNWSLLDGSLHLRLGGMAECYVGFAYNMHNSANNVAQGYATLSVGASGAASYTTPLRLWRRNVTVSYEARLPLVGMMFSPNYGQSYYEMFQRGDYDHNIVPFTIATPSFYQQLSVSLPIGKGRSVSIGYLGDIRQAKPNSLKQHLYTNAVTLGIRKTIK